MKLTFNFTNKRLLKRKALDFVKGVFTDSEDLEAG